MLNNFQSKNLPRKKFITRNYAENFTNKKLWTYLLLVTFGRISEKLDQTLMYTILNYKDKNSIDTFLILKLSKFSHLQILSTIISNHLKSNDFILNNK